MIDFFVSNIYGDKLELNILFKTLMKQNPEYFIKDYNISAVFGSFENSIWNGGRVNRPFDISLEEMQQNILLANENDLSVRYTFTNSLITEKHLNDKTSNYLMDIANNGKNGVIVNSPILFKYLKEKYPKFHYVYSTTNCSLNVEDYNNNYDLYDILVLDWRCNKNKDFLCKLKGKDKIEILVNNTCPLECKNVKNHYLTTDKKNLNFLFHKFNIKKVADSTSHFCLMKEKHNKLFEKYKNDNGVINTADFYIFLNDLKNKNPSIVTREELKWYIDNGFNKFKLSYRSNSYEYIIFNFIYYFSNQGFLDKIFDKLQKTEYKEYSELVRKEIEAWKIL